MFGSKIQNNRFTTLSQRGRIKDITLGRCIHEIFQLVSLPGRNRKIRPVIRSNIVGPHIIDQLKNIENPINTNGLNAYLLLLLHK